MTSKVTVEEYKKNVSEMIEPKFRKYSELSIEQRTDPDFRLKELEKLNEGRLSITCSRCHHCR